MKKLILFLFVALFSGCVVIRQLLSNQFTGLVDQTKLLRN